MKAAKTGFVGQQKAPVWNLRHYKGFSQLIYTINVFLFNVILALLSFTYPLVRSYKNLLTPSVQVGSTLAQWGTVKEVKQSTSREDTGRYVNIYNMNTMK